MRSRPFVRNKDALHTLDLLAQRYNTRPSAILNLTDEWAAYQLDLCALYVGAKDETERAQGKRGKASAGGGDARFDDPLPLATQVVRIADYPDGLW
jgi:hypothetical protein